jgi:flagellar protein FlbD
MILLTKINNAHVAVNCDKFQSIEETPDTVITFENGDKVVVKDRMTEIIDKIVEYRCRIRRLVETEYERQYGRE